MRKFLVFLMAWMLLGCACVQGGSGFGLYSSLIHFESLIDKYYKPHVGEHWEIVKVEK